MLAGMLFCSLLFLQPSLPAHGKHTRLQSYFNEGEVLDPVQLPAEAIQVLQTALSKKDEWPCGFVASAVDLNGDGIDDYIVSADGGQCAGGDNVPYWIVWHDRDGYRLILSERALGLRILKTRTNGFFNLRTKFDIPAGGTTKLWTFREGSYHVAREWQRGDFHTQGAR